ncbi:MAG: D-alanyl-D-alanine carboxypeptidase family protein [Candidatus Zixiibacteriota bacterium]
MILNRSTAPRVLLLLAALVFFSANTAYILDADSSPLMAPYEKVYHFDFDHLRKGGPYLNTKCALLINYDNGEVLYARNTKRKRSVASLTKLVAAMVLLDKEIDLKKTATITKQDARRSSRSRLRVGFELTLYDLLHASLMSSDNRATRALARAASGSLKAFTQEMNKKVRLLGLRHTKFVEPTGLDSKNVSTAREMAKILHYAYDYPLIAKITSKRSYRCKVVNRRRTFRKMTNTNRFIISPYKVLAGKTGYIRAADYCLTTIIQNKRGQRLSLVILGVPGDKLRFKEARRLVDWGFKQLTL